MGSQGGGGGGATPGWAFECLFVGFKVPAYKDLAANVLATRRIGVIAGNPLWA
jgi:hypothetical protein